MPRKKLLPPASASNVPDGELLTEEQLLKHIPITARHLRELRYRRKVPYVVIGHRTILYKLENVVKALEKLEVKAP